MVCVRSYFGQADEGVRAPDLRRLNAANFGGSANAAARSEAYFLKYLRSGGACSFLVGIRKPSALRK